MGKFDGLLLVSDFDDTLYDFQHRVPPRNVEAIRYWIGEGGRFTVATGRAHRTFAPYAHLAPINAPVVLSNGSAIYDFQREKMLVQTLLDPRAPEDFAALMEAIPSLGLETYHGEDIYVYRPNAVTDAHMKKVGTDYEERAIPDMPSPWTKAIVQQEYDELLKARSWLEEHCPGRYEAIFSNCFGFKRKTPFFTCETAAGVIFRSCAISPCFLPCCINCCSIVRHPFTCIFIFRPPLSLHHRSKYINSSLKYTPF